MVELKERIYLTADKKKAVKAGHKDCAFLLGDKGHQITDDQAKKYKINKDGTLGKTRSTSTKNKGDGDKK